MKNLILGLLLFVATANAQVIIGGGGGAKNYKTSVANAAALPLTGNAPADVRFTLDTFHQYVWNGASWTDITGTGGASGITSLNGLINASQTFATGTAGTDFGISSAAGVHTFNFPNSSAVNRGLLTSANWTTFNSKEPAITATTSTDYYRGDKTFQNFNSAVMANGTSANTPNTLIKRGVGGEFASGNIHATSTSFSVAGSTINANNVITVADPTGIVAGMWVADSAGAFTGSNYSPTLVESLYIVQSVLGNQITLNFPAGSTQAADTFTFAKQDWLTADYGVANRGLRVGITDGFGRPTMQWAVPNSMLKLGAWNVDGDPYQIPSQGLVTYFNSIAGAPLDNNNGSIQLLGQNMLWFANEEAGNFQSWFNVDPTSIYYADDTGMTKFSVTRATGAIKTSLGAGIVHSDVSGNLTSSAITSGDVTAALGYTPEDAANKDTDGTLAANSNTKIASQQATKTYADTKQTNIVATTSADYYRGDKTFQPFNAAAQSALAGLYEVPLTFSTGLTRTTNTITVNTSQNISTLSNLTSNGFVKTSGGTGALSIDTNTYQVTKTISSITSNTTGASTVETYFADTTGGAFTFTLPAAASNSGVRFLVKHTTFGSANAVSVARTGADLIEGATSDTINAGEAREYVSNGTNWFLAQ
jgi:hypothetical protein